MTTIGVLALQGDFREHIRALQELGVQAVPVKLPAQLDGIDGLIIPGGESTVIGKLMVSYNLVEPLHARILGGMPTWGTCAGMILLAKETENGLAGQPLLAAMDIAVDRNAFGNQNDSFITEVAVPVLGTNPVTAVFIRAPIVTRVDAGVDVLARLASDAGPIIAVRQGKLLATAFHPEMTGDTRFHRYFLDIVQGGAPS